MSQGWIAVDLDGTLAHYVAWDDGKIGAPIPLMLARVQEWLTEGKQVKIMTARVSGGPESAETVVQQRQAIQDWCFEHLGQWLEVTCRKDYAMICLYDDRCVQVEANTGRLIGEETYPREECLAIQWNIHPEEARPRGETWLHERTNWQVEVDRLRSKVAELESQARLHLGLVDVALNKEQECEALRAKVAELEAMRRMHTRDCCSHWDGECDCFPQTREQLQQQVTFLVASQKRWMDLAGQREAQWVEHQNNIAAERAARGLSMEDALELLQPGDFIITMIKGPIPGVLLQGVYDHPTRDAKNITLKHHATFPPTVIGRVLRDDEVIYEHPRFAEVIADETKGD